MGDRTKIDWCDASWNPVTGCLHECEYCYTRFPGIQFTSDVLFMDDILEKKPQAVWLDQPMYFYNYMREGSQTEEHSRKNGGD